MQSKTRSNTEVDVSLSERLRHIWTLLTTDEVVREDGSTERRRVRRPPRA